MSDKFDWMNVSAAETEVCEKSIILNGERKSLVMALALHGKTALRIEEVVEHFQKEHAQLASALNLIIGERDELLKRIEALEKNAKLGKNAGQTDSSWDVQAEQVPEEDLISAVDMMLIAKPKTICWLNRVAYLLIEEGVHLINVSGRGVPFGNYYVCKADENQGIIGAKFNGSSDEVRRFLRSASGRVSLWEYNTKTRVNPDFIRWLIST